MKKTLLTTCVLLFASIAANASNAGSEATAYENKLRIEKKMFELKVEQEKQLMKDTGKSLMSQPLDFTTTLFHPLVKQECVEWVYKGPGSREDAIRACRGVENMNCVRWVYKGPGSRVEAAQACKGEILDACYEWVYKGPGSRVEAVNACRGVWDMECVEFAYKGPYSRQEAARMCADEDDDDEC